MADQPRAEVSINDTNMDVGNSRHFGGFFYAICTMGARNGIQFPDAEL